MVNEAIQAKVPVVCEEMTVPEAKEKGAIGLFESKYGEKVRTYKMGDYSFEICGGPTRRTPAIWARSRFRRKNPLPLASAASRRF